MNEVKKMSEDQVKEYLKNRGWSKMVWERGAAYLIERWHQCAITFEKEREIRNWNIDDYRIFLHIRDQIHDIGYDDAVKEDDEKFRSALTATNIRHRRKEQTGNYDFWNYGYPKNAAGFFYDQIKLHILDDEPTK